MLPHANNDACVIFGQADVPPLIWGISPVKDGA
jgi:hypothetical protein